MENGSSVTRDRDGALFVGGCSVAELAGRFGTPLHVIDEERLRRNCQDYRRAFGSRWPQVEVIYASKACSILAVLAIVAQEGLSVDVSSAGELASAFAAGVPARRLVQHGSYKTTVELREAVAHRLGRIVIDAEDEIDQLVDIARAAGRRPRVLLRIAPGVEPSTHPSFRTGGSGTKFGVDVGTGAAARVARAILARPELDLLGYHLHIGSQIKELEPFQQAAGVAVDLMAQVARETGHVAEELDLGGGLGISYGDGAPPTCDAYAAAVTDALTAGLARHGLPRPRLLLEPGRSIVGDAGITVYRVGPVKPVGTGTTYVSIDGGMSDNPRPGLYRARHPLVHATRATGPDAPVVTIVGKHPERDCVLEDVPLPPVRRGDLVAMLCTGAYTFSMASNYNRTPHPAVVLVREGQAELIVRRQRLSALLDNDIVPERVARKRRQPVGGGAPYPVPGPVAAAGGPKLGS